MMNVAAYELIARPERVSAQLGGQELILAEVCAALAGPRVKVVFLPFYSSGALAHALRARLGLQVFTDPSRDLYDVTDMPLAQALYFGTPTIVAGRSLFPQREEWTVEKERMVVRDLCRNAAHAEYDCIVSGLGSGDISPEDRISDMTHYAYETPEIVCMKKFEAFTDWVIVSRRRQR